MAAGRRRLFSLFDSIVHWRDRGADEDAEAHRKYLEDVARQVRLIKLNETEGEIRRLGGSDEHFVAIPILAEPGKRRTKIITAYYRRKDLNAVLNGPMRSRPVDVVVEDKPYSLRDIPFKNDPRRVNKNGLLRIRGSAAIRGAATIIEGVEIGVVHYTPWSVSRIAAAADHAQAYGLEYVIRDGGIVKTFQPTGLDLSLGEPGLTFRVSLVPKSEKVAEFLEAVSEITHRHEDEPQPQHAPRFRPDSPGEKRYSETPPSPGTLEVRLSFMCLVKEIADKHMSGKEGDKDDLFINTLTGLMDRSGAHCFLNNAAYENSAAFSFRADFIRGSDRRAIREMTRLNGCLAAAFLEIAPRCSGEIRWRIPYEGGEARRPVRNPDPLHPA